RLIKAARGSRAPPRLDRMAVGGGQARRAARGAAGLELCDRHEHLVDLALHVARLAGSAVAQKAREVADRLSGALIGDAVDHDDGDAIGRAHRGWCTGARSAARATPRAR